MVPDRQKVRTDGMDGRTHGRRQNYIPLTSSGDINIVHMKILDTSFKMTKRRFRLRGQKMCITRVKCNTSINNLKNVNLPFLQSIRFNIFPFAPTITKVI